MGKGNGEGKGKGEREEGEGEGRKEEGRGKTHGTHSILVRLPRVFCEPWFHMCLDVEVICGWGTFWFVCFVDFRWW
jgi:hypothetical protein